MRSRIEQAQECINSGADPLLFASFANLTRRGVSDLSYSTLPDVFMELHAAALEEVLNKIPEKAPKKRSPKKNSTKNSKESSEKHPKKNLKKKSKEGSKKPSKKSVKKGKA
jgi:hypothetical protein